MSGGVLTSLKPVLKALRGHLWEGHWGSQGHSIKNQSGVRKGNLPALQLAGPAAAAAAGTPIVRADDQWPHRDESPSVYRLLLFTLSGPPDMKTWEGEALLAKQVLSCFYFEKETVAPTYNRIYFLFLIAVLCYCKGHQDFEVNTLFYTN